MQAVTALLALLLPLVLDVAGYAAPIEPIASIAQATFPASTAQEQDVSPESLARLDQLIAKLVEDDEVVGAELLVIKSGRSILHEAYGWSDRDAERPMETGSVYCVRSMTKPIIGTAILMLIEEGKLALDDRVAKYLPAFEAESTREITVEQLLGHTSGLPLSLILGQELSSLESIQMVAQLGAGTVLEFEPGTNFNYSDQGTDTLTALIEIVAEQPAADFVQSRVLGPIGMGDSACFMAEGHRLRERGCSKYIGSKGSWNRFWGPEDPPLFPIFLGSQGLYSTVEDYARFMQFWKNEGRVGDRSLLGSEFVRKALVPNPYRSGFGAGFPNIEVGYGYLMQLWFDPERKASDNSSERPSLVAFGHGGSDGTHAWVFPEQDAMVFYFTQSRGNRTGYRVEQALAEMFLGIEVAPAVVAKDVPDFEPYLGYYWEGEGDTYRAIIRDGEQLALEIPGRGVVPLVYVEGDRWKLEPNPTIELSFQRSEQGEIMGYQLAGNQEFRFQPNPELPTVEELARSVKEAHRLDLLESLGPLRMTGELKVEKFKMTGKMQTYYSWPHLFRVDSQIAGQFENYAFDGENIWYESPIQSTVELEDEAASLLRLDSLYARFGDWRAVYPKLEVIQRIVRKGESIFLVRTGDTSGPARTLYVHGETGRVVRQDGLTYANSIGRIGQRLSFEDFREVSGMLLPFRTRIESPNPVVGMIEAHMVVDDYELGGELPEGLFALSN